MDKNSTTNYEYPKISNRLIECLERDFSSYKHSGLLDSIAPAVPVMLH